MLKFLTIAATLLVAYNTTVKGYDWTCLGEKVNNDFDLRLLQICYDQSAVERNQTGESSLCISICYFKQIHVIDENGMYNSDGMSNFTKLILPSLIHENVTKEADKCAVSKGNMFSDENDCTGFLEFMNRYYNKVEVACGLASKYFE